MRPDKWFGQPESARKASNGWYVSAAVMSSETAAQRLAAILNHQGPPIPAQVVPSGERHQVIAGPFANAKAAKTAVKRLKVDLELEGHIIAPRSKQATKPSAEPAVRETVFPNTELDSPVW